MKSELKLKSFHSWKCIWKCRLRNGGHFVQGDVLTLTHYAMKRGQTVKHDTVRNIFCPNMNKFPGTFGIGVSLLPWFSSCYVTCLNPLGANMSGSNRSICMSFLGIDIAQVVKRFRLYRQGFIRIAQTIPLLFSSFKLWYCLNFPWNSGSNDQWVHGCLIFLYPPTVVFP